MSLGAGVDFRYRATDAEELDLGVDDDEARRSLADLRFVNRWLGGRRAIARAVLPHLRADSRLLDVGCGSGDLPAFLTRSAAVPFLAVGLDVKALHLREAPPEVRPVVADVRQLPFGPRSFDVVTASLFLHHFDAPELPGVLRALFALCRGVFVVNDLHRARVPYAFSRLFMPLAFKSPVSVNDGLLSIRRAFTPRELAGAFSAAGIAGATVTRRFPYRLVAVAEA
ncbi:MAG TPA: methyltransferase domain-containing protein [Vicinamibacteria bacterium]|nr:methyltransferase domain-containing protein [Vicinamibacteria bacterium]